MYKKAIAIILICVMLVSISPAVAADDAPVKPTIEEILNDYHQKTLESRTANERGAAANYSRNSNSGSKSLEQETVDILTAAGYEAYNVTSDNYATLETELKTDFAEMGIDPNGSYIVAVGGQDSNITKSDSRAINLPSEEDFGGQDGSFTYTYNGTTYIMRFVTVTAADDPGFRVSTAYSLSNIDNKPNIIGDILSTTLSMAIDSKTGKIPIGTILSLLGGWIPRDNQGNLLVLDSNTIIIHAETVWTRNYIQIWHSGYGRWYTAQSSAYANSLAYCAGTAYDSALNRPVPVIGEPQSKTTYALYYNNTEQRKIIAVESYVAGIYSHAFTGDIGFYLVEETGEINFNETQDPLFAHEDPFNLLPTWCEP